MLISFPDSAFADGRLSAAGGFANLTSFSEGSRIGPGAMIGGALDLTQFFALTLDVGASHHFANSDRELPADTVGHAGFGLRYNFDVFKYVPYGGLAATGYLDAPAVEGQPVTANAGGKLFLGVDWRFDRHWSVGVHGELHGLLSDLDGFPIYTFVGISAAYYLRL